MTAETLPQILEDSASLHPAARALVMRAGVRSVRLTYAGLRQRAHAYARLTHQHNVRPGDRVLIWAENQPDWIAAMFGTFIAGGVLVPLDIRSTQDFVERVVTQTEPVLAFAGPRQAEILRRLEIPTLEFENLNLPLDGRFEGPRITPDTLAEIIYTSGTTGDPKGVQLTHGNIASNVAAGLKVIDLTPEDRFLSLLPLSHMFEQVCGCFAPLAAGASIHFPTSRQPSALSRTMQESKPTIIAIVPQALTLLMNGIEREAANQGKAALLERLRHLAVRLPMRLRRVLFATILRRLGGSIRMFASGGAALSPALRNRWELMGIPVLEGYGTTECSPIVTITPPPDRRPHSVGIPLPGVQVRLAADGEVQVRGPNVFPGYWKNPAATATVFEDGWYRTGDLGYFEGGQLYLKGRKKDLIVLSDGQNVYPEDVEQVLTMQPGIRDAVVLGLTEDDLVRLHAVILEEHPGAGTEAVRLANLELSDRQQIRGVSVWHEEDFPRTHTLKVKRPLVEAWLQDQSTTATPLRPAIVDDDPIRRLIALAAPYGDDIQDDHLLGTDLGIDSLGRVELLSSIEEQLGVFIDDGLIGPATSVADLRALVNRGRPRSREHTFPTWPRWRTVRAVRALLNTLILLPGVRLFYTARVRGQHHLRAVKEPCLIISNHNMHLDMAMLLLAMPFRFRQRVAIAAAADDIFGNRVRGFGSSLIGNAFPFAKEGSGIRESLEYVTRMLDEGWHVVIFPEGKLTVLGPTQPFKGGIGLLARETGVPVLPMRIDVLRPGFYEGRWFPHPRATVRVNIGQPLRIPPGTSYAEATALLEQAVRDA